MSELKPCPFCGGEAELKQTGRKGLTIKCKSCQIKLHQKVLNLSLEWLEPKMIESWNKRWEIDQVIEILEDYISVCGWPHVNTKAIDEIRKRFNLPEKPDSSVQKQAENDGFCPDDQGD
jgi:Lar family restriction alleviation protein